jgi:hypothetical protein
MAEFITAPFSLIFNIKGRSQMRLAIKMLIFALPVLLLTAPASGHHLWVSVDDGDYAVNRGLISERTDAYNPACVQEIKAYGQDGEPLSVERINEAEQVWFKTGAPAALAVVMSKWGDRVNTTRGKKLMSRSEAEKAGLTVISAFFSTQFSKTLFKPSDRNQEPLGMQFEIVPQQCPLTAKPGEPVSFLVRFKGKPLSDTAIYTQGDREIRTDENGVARIAFDKSGKQLIYAKHERPAKAGTELDYLKFMTFLIFEVNR